jgi:hypothetical protein
MNAAAIVGILVALVVVGGIAYYLIGQRRRTEALQSRYGPEYTRTVSEVGSQRGAEDELVKRQERVEHLEIRPLLADQRQLFTQQWRAVQARFVDDPGGAVTRADGLVEEVMKTRGYPVADFDQRAADLSVHHARVVDNYRAAREIAERHRRSSASTEDLRKAMVYYRELFEDLLEDRERSAERAPARVADRAVERQLEYDAPRSADQRPPAEDRAPTDDRRVIRSNNKDVRP